MSATKFIFDEAQERQIIEAIRAAEQRTSGEIRLHVEPHCHDEKQADAADKDPFERALEVFAELGMHQTKLQNGVLFYLAYESHKFAIVADAGINARVEEGFWEDIKEKMIPYFKNSNFVEGLALGIRAAGERLREFFPETAGGSGNELSDDISRK